MFSQIADSIGHQQQDSGSDARLPLQVLRTRLQEHAEELGRRKRQLKVARRGLRQCPRECQDNLHRSEVGGRRENAKTHFFFRRQTKIETKKVVPLSGEGNPENRFNSYIEKGSAGPSRG